MAKGDGMKRHTMATASWWGLTSGGVSVAFGVLQRRKGRETPPLQKKSQRVEGAAAAADGPCCGNRRGNPGEQDLGAGVLPPPSYIFFLGGGGVFICCHRSPDSFSPAGSRVDNPALEGDGQPAPADPL